MGNRNKNISQTEFPFRLTIEIKRDRHYSGRSKLTHAQEVLAWLFGNVGTTINYRDKENNERPMLKEMKLPHDVKYSKDEPQFIFKIKKSKERYSDTIRMQIFFRNAFDKTNFAINHT